MARWAGVIGFAKDTEVEPGVWEETIEERKYKGDAIKMRLLSNLGTNINPQVNVSNQISFIADPYALQNFSCIRYISFMGQLWNVNDITIDERRLIATIGGAYCAGKK